MKDEDILDEPILENEPRTYSEAIRWWENKRLLFNVILLLVHFFSALNHLEEIKEIGVLSYLIFSIYLIVIYNIAYSFGWILELIFLLITGYNQYHPNWRWTLYTIGLIFSILLVFVFYAVRFSPF